MRPSGKRSDERLITEFVVLVISRDVCRASAALKRLIACCRLTKAATDNLARRESVYFLTE